MNKENSFERARKLPSWDETIAKLPAYDTTGIHEFNPLIARGKICVTCKNKREHRQHAQLVARELPVVVK